MTIKIHYHKLKEFGKNNAQGIHLLQPDDYELDRAKDDCHAKGFRDIHVYNMAGKRCKEVFPMKELAHVWAHQLQESGRVKSDRMYFNGDTIYSYGSHYAIARIYKGKNGKPFALVNEHGYSMQTGVHCNAVTFALDGLMPYHYAKEPRDIKASATAKSDLAKEAVASALRSIKVTNRQSISWTLRGILNVYKEANVIRVLAGLKPIKPSARDLKAVRKHLEFRLKRYKELNTPEMIEKKRLAAERRAERKEKLEARKAELAALALKDKIAAFRKGEPVQFSWHDKLDTDLIQVRKNMVYTSKGASVPLKDAVDALKQILKNGKKAVGAAVGNFRVDEVEKDRVRLGCHTILLADAKAVLLPHAVAA